VLCTKAIGTSDHPTTSPSLTTPAVATKCRAKVSDRVGFRLKSGEPGGCRKGLFATPTGTELGHVATGPQRSRPVVPRAVAHNQFLPPETHSESLDMCRRPEVALGAAPARPYIADRVELAQAWIGSSSVWVGPLPGGVLEVGSGCAFSARPAFHRRKAQAKSSEERPTPKLWEGRDAAGQPPLQPQLISRASRAPKATTSLTSPRQSGVQHSTFASSRWPALTSLAGTFRSRGRPRHVVGPAIVACRARVDQSRGRIARSLRRCRHMAQVDSWGVAKGVCRHPTGTPLSAGSPPDPRLCPAPRCPGGGRKTGRDLRRVRRSRLVSWKAATPAGLAGCSTLVEWHGSLRDSATWQSDRLHATLMTEAFPR